MKIFIQTGHNSELAIFEFKRVVNALAPQLISNDSISKRLSDNLAGFYTIKLNTDSINYNIPEQFWQELILQLGGTIRIGKLISLADKNEADKFFDESTISLGNKFNYSISGLGSNKKIDEFKKLFKSFAKKNKLKVTNKTSLGEGQLLSPSRYWSTGLNQGIELLLIAGAENKSEFVVAQTLAVTDPSLDASFDKNRPSTKITHSSSFRLARILINILAGEGIEKIIDPFCGTGTILMAGLNRGYKVYGIDNDPELIKIANENIDWWLRNHKQVDEKDVKVVLGDSLNHKVEDFEPQAIVFEPYMGEFLHELPTYQKLQQITKKLYKFYAKLFANLADQITKPGLVSCVLPDFQAKSGEIIEVPEVIFSDHGWELVNEKLPYSAADGSRLRRNVYFLKRAN